MFTPSYFSQTERGVVDIVDTEIRVYICQTATVTTFADLFPDIPITDIGSLKKYADRDGANPADIIINTLTREW